MLAAALHATTLTTAVDPATTTLAVFAWLLGGSGLWWGARLVRRRRHARSELAGS